MAKTSNMAVVLISMFMSTTSSLQCTIVVVMLGSS